MTVTRLCCEKQFPREHIHIELVTENTFKNNLLSQSVLGGKIQVLFGPQVAVKLFPPLDS